MSELRKHPLTGQWVIINKTRGKRPGFTVFPKIEKKGGICPFCSGNESTTPPEVYAIRDGHETDCPGWRVRVVPNKFAMIGNEGVFEALDEGFYQKMTGVGAHEVVVESPDHEKELHDLPVSSISEVMLAFRERFRELKKNPQIKYVHLFKNHGFMGGGSLEHTHSQIVALPIVTKAVTEEERSAKTFYEEKGRCIFCDMVSLETEKNTRLVMENDGFIAFCPYAPRSAFETWIVPKVHESHFENIDDREISLLAEVLKPVLLKIKSCLNGPAYNFAVYTAPVQQAGKLHYHWRLEIMPQSSPIGGFERATGFYVNPVSPEDAAEMLRSAELKSLV